MDIKWEFLEEWLVSHPKKFIEATRDPNYKHYCDEKTSFENITNGLRILDRARKDSRNKNNQNTIPRLPCDEVKERLEGAKIKVKHLVKYGNERCEIYALNCKTDNGDNTFDGIFIRYGNDFLMVAIDGAHRFMDSTWFSYQNSDGSSSELFGEWDDDKEEWVIDESEFELDTILEKTSESFMLGVYDMQH